MKILIVALSTGNAMGQYLEEFIPELSQYCELHLILPKKNSLNFCQTDVKLHFVDTGASSLSSIIKFINPFSFNEIREIVNSISPKLIHIFNSEGYPWNVFLSNFCKRKKIPLLTTVHDPIPHPGNIFELINSILRKVTLLNSKSVHIHDEMFTDVTKKNGNFNIEVIPHGSISSRYTKLSTEVFKDSDYSFILFFGRVEKYKGIDTLIKSLDYLPKDLKLVIAGKGILPDLVNEPQYQDRIIVKNYYIEDTEISYLLRKCKLLVLPYIQASQSSLPDIGAAFDKPVVGSDVGALGKEIRKYGGYTVPPGNPQMLAEKIIYAIENGRHNSIKSPDFKALSPLFFEWYKGNI